jgi:16S rRNA (guanine966-N2)-methyltransferase
MRVTGGEWRGRRLAVPRGRDVRPTSDRVRESLFALLTHNAWGRDAGPVLPHGFVLDGCAGTGALGIEALSRGAAHAIFFDVAASSLDCVRENLVMLGAGSRATVRRTDATTPPTAKPGEACDLVLLDPPYASDVAARALPALAARDWLARDAIVVIEHAGDAPEIPPGFVEVDRREYGTTELLVLRFERTHGT